jgi:hypothetical protein
MKKEFFKLTLIAIAAFLFSATVYSFKNSKATCSGGANCHACKNCKYCKHCHRDGGTCSVCKK